MKIRDILKVKGSKVWIIRENQTVEDALHMLVSHKIGALLVLNENGSDIAGIISERDIVRAAYVRGPNLNIAPVREFMTSHVLTASADDEISDIMHLMTERRIRHLPVVDSGALQGLVSIGDVVKILVHESEHEIRHLKEYMYGPEKEA